MVASTEALIDDYVSPSASPSGASPPAWLPGAHALLGISTHLRDFGPAGNAVRRGASGRSQGRPRSRPQTSRDGQKFVQVRPQQNLLPGW